MIFSDLPKRLMVSCLSIALIAAIAIFAYSPIVLWLLAIGLAVMSGIGVWEYGKLSKLDGKKGFIPLLIVFGTLVIWSFCLSTTRAQFALLPIACLFLALIFIFLFHLDKAEGAIASISQGFFAIVYVTVPLGLALKVLYLNQDVSSDHGRLWILYLVVVTKITDVGAYFGGKIMGKRKLAPRVSPGKTVAGSVIGLISAIVFSFLFYLLGQFFGGISLSLIDSLWLGALLGSLGQVGDLAESLFKRDAAVKDSNRLPGFGGILDIIDSLILTAPTVYLFLHLG